MNTQIISDEAYAKKIQQIISDEEMAKKMQSDWNQFHIDPKGDFKSVIQKVLRMPGDATAKHLAGKYGFNINTVSWEDNARTKGSSWGPCISDMTLRVEDSNLPVIRSPNFEDLTWDVPIEKIPLVVGNEHGENLRTITLKEYLGQFPFYLHAPTKWKSENISLLADRDSQVIMSSQACFLPVPKEGEAKFNVAIFNYQSSKNNPAVLAIVANEKGTSAQIVENVSGGQKLFFNNNGQKCSFIGQRLTDFRIEKGETDLSKPMTQEEKQKNMLLIIQIPLKHKTVYRNFYGGGGYDLDACLAPMSMSNTKMLKKKNVHYQMEKEMADVDDAVIHIGASEGAFEEIGNVQIERDPSFPIRVTLQFYKATSNGVFDESHIATISEQIKESRKFGVAIGSLVVGGNTGRVTEHTHHNYSRPPWWDDFWLMYKDVYPQYTSDTAAALVFKNGRFSNQDLNQSKQQVLDILGGDSVVNSQPPVWKVM